MLTRLTLSCLLVLTSTGLSANPQKTGDFALLDQAGEHHQLSRYRDHRALVIMSVGSECKTDKQPLSAYRKLIKRYGEQKVAFFLLNAESTDRTALSEFAKKHNLDLPVLMDETQLVAKTLDLHNSAEVAVINPQDQSLLYRGPISHKYQAQDTDKGAKQDYLATALNSFLNDGAATELDLTLASNGCALPKQNSQAGADISFNQDIVPILEANCTSCHREGGIGPFAMNSHAMIRGWAPMIREVVMAKRMPPAQIDPLYNHDFKDIGFLTVAEQQILVNWIDAGAHNNAKADALAELSTAAPEWQLGEPDLIVEVPAQEVPATGVIDYRYEKIPLNLEQDIWVKAVEFLPSALDVMHHIIAFSLDTPNFSELELLNQGVGLGAYAPGAQPTIFPDNTGYKLSAGGGLYLQLHYTTSGKARVDKTRIGLYLHDQQPAISMHGGSAAEFNLKIPPHTKESPMTAERTFDKDIYLVSLAPHMHFRGKEFKYTLVYPDGKEQVILSVPNYQFNWQRNYDFVEPLFVPAGSRLIADGAFDNSAMNPHNPDPSVTVTWGEQSWNEMFFGFYRYHDAETAEMTNR